MSYTVKISDPKDLINSGTEDKLSNAAIYVIELISTYVHWEGVMDVEVAMADHASLPDGYGDPDGLLP